MRPLAPLLALLAVAAAFAQTPPPPAKRLPPAGLALPAKDRADLTAAAAKLRAEIDTLARELASTPTLAALLPDLEIYHKAVDWALRYDEFFSLKEISTAQHLLAVGQERVARLRKGRAPWLEATGFVVRGYRSKLDGSVQPYGLFIPPHWKREEPGRLQVWLLGRGEKRTELAFMSERESRMPELAPANTLLLIPYGRFCNATKFAGEVDVFEAMDAVRRENVIDPARLSVAGFSMGGASTWHLATHHPGLWCSASPGAGFAEVASYQRAYLAKEPPTWWEQKLWGWYNATSYAGNLFNVPTIAYSGELDPQKASADLMEAACAAEGLKLERLIGPKTEHKYEPATKKELVSRLEKIADAGRDPVPREVRLSTYSLRYPGRTWVQFAGLARHWDRADLTARYTDDGTATITTKNVTAVTVTLPRLRALIVDGQPVSVPTNYGAAGFTVHHQSGRWWSGEPSATLRKRPGLTGPIDDAFMEPFVFVRPTGQPLSEKLGTWTTGELARATKMWRDIFRGDAPVKDDSALTDTDIANQNLVLWGDPASNRVLAKLLPQLPLKWTAKEIEFRGQTYDAAHHAPILIFPNPLNPARYVVLNSGIDFRDHAYGSNSLQLPKLPDYAIIDLRTPPGPRWPGKIVDAGFFDEAWK
ncbi:MAG: prolyl oligopeptidase family serine peptidase [Verrucomicrobia bacterium]|nr:prolyl oligopeptidase family serine peptidase [Verrucomicrobiota bacterium]